MKTKIASAVGSVAVVAAGLAVYFVAPSFRPASAQAAATPLAAVYASAAERFNKANAPYAADIATLTCSGCAQNWSQLTADESRIAYNDNQFAADILKMESAFPASQHEDWVKLLNATVGLYQLDHALSGTRYEQEWIDLLPLSATTWNAYEAADNQVRSDIGLAPIPFDGKAGPRKA